jgi:hypothetical protein
MTHDEMYRLGQLSETHSAVRHLLQEWREQVLEIERLKQELRIGAEIAMSSLRRAK